MSIGELADVQVTSVSQQNEPLGRAAASIQVITIHDSRRSGAQSLPEDELTYRVYAKTFFDRVLLSISGRNLLHERHLEYAQGAAIPRSAFADIQWRF